MKAIWLERTGAANRLKLVDKPVPEPGPGQVRIKVESAGVNFADVLTRRGEYYPQPEMPLVPGTDVAGAIDALGEGVDGLQEGEHVVAITPHGGYAQYCLTAAAAVVPLPDGIDFDLAAGLPVSGMTAYHLTHSITALAPGKTVVNYSAAGSVGSLINGLAKTRRARVIALVGSAAKVERVRELGADEVILYPEEDDVPARVRELTGGRGVDVIYNAVMGKTIADDMKMLAPLGHAVWFGIAGGMPNAKLLLASLMRKFTQAPTITMYHLLAHMMHDPERHRHGWGELFGYLLAGKCCLPLHDIYPLGQAARAHEDLESRSTMGKCILKPWN